MNNARFEQEGYIEGELCKLSIVLDRNDVVDSQTDQHVHDDYGHHEDEDDEDEARVKRKGVVPCIRSVLCVGFFPVMVFCKDSLKLVFPDHHHKGLEQCLRRVIKCKLKGEIKKG